MSVLRMKGKAPGKSETGRLGKALSKQRCYCGKRITMLAKKFGDPYCSRICLERSLGIEKKSISKEEVDDYVGKARTAKGRAASGD